MINGNTLLAFFLVAMNAEARVFESISALTLGACENKDQFVDIVCKGKAAEFLAKNPVPCENARLAAYKLGMVETLCSPDSEKSLSCFIYAGGKIAWDDESGWPLYQTDFKRRKNFKGTVTGYLYKRCPSTEMQDLNLRLQCYKKVTQELKSQQMKAYNDAVKSQKEHPRRMAEERLLDAKLKVPRRNFVQPRYRPLEKDRECVDAQSNGERPTISDEEGYK